MTELHAAVGNRDMKRVKQLLGKKNAKIFLTSFDEECMLPITLAMRNDDNDMVQLLLEGYKQTKADINLKDKTGYTALHQSVTLCDDQVLVTLLSFPGLNVNVENDDGNTPLHYFCQKFKSPSCHDAFIAFRYKGANVNARNKNGETPLHKAIFNSSARIIMVNLLLKEGKADVNICNSQGETPLHYAVRLRRNDLVAALLKAGADSTISGMSKSGEHMTPWELAKQEKDADMIACFQQAIDLREWLHSINMEQYYMLFAQQDAFLLTLAHVQVPILKRMGVVNPDHAAKIAKEAQILGVKLSRGLSFNSSLSSGSDQDRTSRASGLTDEDLFSIDTRDITSLRDHLSRSGSSLELLTFSDLEFTENLSSGGFAKVYKAIYKGDTVAVKVLKSMPNASEVEEFRKEYAIMDAMRSPYVVKFYGAVLEPKLCMVMEFCGRGSLYHVLKDETQTIGWSQFFHFALQTVEGTAALHSWVPPIVHRDLKTLNLLVNDAWDVKVADFGLSRFNTNENMETLAQMRGTGAYCAPELFLGESFSAKSDIYSIGIILWELVARTITGQYQRPFGEFEYLKKDYQIMMQTSTQGLRPTIPPSTPKELASLIKQCVLQDVESRPSCEELAAHLRSLAKAWRDHPGDWEAALRV
eukprot:TRINITY_DN1597_c0_g2_i2.p1 TRINITY_DN1597_c0_g2~~TRINITY_DN1597_c0_g2_i2.p1  ORF type:complete len:643 (-),score=161.00 TRINITY_DN1597_c0_g2_i2:74-2002(-)